MNTEQDSTKAGQQPPSAVEDAIAHGIDVEQLKTNLARTPAERMRRHDIALHTANMLRKAKRK